MTTIQFPLCHLLFECQCMKVICDILAKGIHRFSSRSFENDLDHFVHGFCLAHSHPSCLWSLDIYADKQVEMMAMGMRYADVAPGNGGSIEQIYSAIASSKIFTFCPNINDVKALELSLPPRDFRLELEFFKDIPLYFPKLQVLFLFYHPAYGSLDDYQTLTNVLPKLKYLRTL